MSEHEQDFDNIRINNFMLDEANNMINRFKFLLKFFNDRVRHYNIEIYNMTNKIIKLKKDIITYYDILDEYKKDVSKQTKIDILECKICRDELSNCVIEPCKHLVCCYECFKKIEDGKCPICRSDYTTCFKIYY